MADLQADQVLQPVASITFLKPMSTGRHIVVCGGHLHRHAAETNGPERKSVL